MTDLPSPNGSNGRDTGGRFVQGNAGGPGNPHGRRTAEFRRLMLEAVSDDDLRAVVAKLVSLAKEGEMPAIRELLDRVLGKPKSTLELVEADLADDELNRELEYAVEQVAAIRKASVACAGEG